MKNIVILAAIILLVSCSESDDVSADNTELINPADAQAISEVLIMPSGSINNSGNPPPPSNSHEAPSVGRSIDNITSSNGATAPLLFTYNEVQGNLGGCYVQIDGAESYFNIPYRINSGTSGDLQLPLGIPTNVDQGSFCASYCVYDNNGLVSNVVTTCIEILRLGTGDLQISLTWDSPTDQDLYVVDPNGEEISYLVESSSSGGTLDRDDTDGYGPENIFWTENAPNGLYQVFVNDFEGTTTPNACYVTVSSPGTTRSFSANTQNGNTVNVISFTKEGNSLRF